MNQSDYAHCLHIGQHYLHNNFYHAGLPTGLLRAAIETGERYAQLIDSHAALTLP